LKYCKDPKLLDPIVGWLMLIIVDVRVGNILIYCNLVMIEIGVIGIRRC
jgi:hypothetical protein